MHPRRPRPKGGHKHDRRSTQRLLGGLVAIALIGIGLACGDYNMVASDKPAIPAVRADYYNPNCGASYTMITSDYDDLMAPYGIGTTVDTANVCETWVGNDYTLHAAVVGSSENVDPSTDDIVQGTDYRGGIVTPYDANGSVAGPADGTSGSTAFDLMAADASLRQASYDDPYYGIRAPGGTTCIQPPCAAMSVGTTATLRSGSAPRSLPPAIAPSANSDSGPQFGRHRVSRRGLRALVDAAEEISRTKQGHRRFQKMNGRESTTYVLDKDTELLIGEEHSDSVTIMTVSHTWKLVNGMYMRDRTEINSVEKIYGRDHLSRTTITFLNVHLNASALAPVTIKETP